MIKTNKITTALLAGSMALLLAACDKPANEPSVGASKAAADNAASSALDAARAAAVDTGQALKETAIAAKHEADAAVVKVQESSTSGDVQGAMHRVGDDAKEVLATAADKTRDLAQDAKQKVDQKSSSSAN